MIVILRMMKWAGHIGWMKKVGSAYKLLFGKPEGKRPLGRPRCR
jgi:hypothetical protein